MPYSTQPAAGSMAVDAQTGMGPGWLVRRANRLAVSESSPRVVDLDAVAPLALPQHMGEAADASNLSSGIVGLGPTA